MRTILSLIVIVISLPLISCKKSSCIKGNCVNGVGIYKHKNNRIDSGEFRYRKLNGFGKRIFGEGKFEGDIYIGEFSHGVFDGHGTYYHSKHDAKFIGFSKNGTRHGEGKVIFGKNSIQGLTTFYGTWENGICDEYEDFIRISKNGEYVFYKPNKFMDSLTYHVNYSSRHINELIRLANEIHSADLSKVFVDSGVVNKITSFINQGVDTISLAINSITNLKEFDQEIPLKQVTINYLELIRSDLDIEFRNWALRLKSYPSETKHSELQNEINPIIDTSLSINKKIKLTQALFMKKHKITFK